MTNQERIMTNQRTTAVHVRRTIAAPPDRVYRAWLDPRLMVRWFAPASYTARKAEVDERVGGRVSIWHVDGAGTDVGGAEAEIIELVPGKRIVLRWQFVGPDRTTDPAIATRLTITFTATPDGTQLDLTHDRLDGLRDRFPHIAEQVRPGWEVALDALVAVGW
jgi:uncharacterized protein YndB with AHSA1/START domain